MRTTVRSPAIAIGCSAVSVELVDATGRLRGVYNGSMPFEVAKLIEDIDTLATEAPSRLPTRTPCSENRSRVSVLLCRAALPPQARDNARLAAAEWGTRPPGVVATGGAGA